MGGAPRLTDELKPCPFCCVSLRIVCRDDPKRGLVAIGATHPDGDCWLATYDIDAFEFPSWNRRAQSEGQAKVVEARRQAIEECAKVCEQKLLVFDGCGDVKIGVDMAGKLLVHAIRALTPIGDREAAHPGGRGE